MVAITDIVSAAPRMDHVSASSHPTPAPPPDIRRRVRIHPGNRTHALAAYLNKVVRGSPSHAKQRFLLPAVWGSRRCELLVHAGADKIIRGVLRRMRIRGVTVLSFPMHKDHKTTYAIDEERARNELVPTLPVELYAHKLTARPQSQHSPQ